MQNVRHSAIPFWKGSLSVGIAVFAAVLLPQVIHAIGLATGTGGALGQMLLPMYLPVLIVALRTNAAVGLVAGVLSPLVSFSISGMPSLEMLPFILTELAVLGVCGGLLARRSLHPLVKILATQGIARLARIIVTVLWAFLITHTPVSAAAIGTAVLTAIPGYLIQLLAVPFVIGNRPVDHES